MTTISRDRDFYDVWTTVTTRYSDQDPMQHINNVAITAYLESGRTGLFNTIFGPKLIPSRSMVLAGLTIDYLHELVFPTPVEVGAKLVRVGSKSLTAHFAIFQNDRCCVVSQSTNVFFDPKTRTSAEPSPEVRQRLKDLMGQRET